MKFLHLKHQEIDKEKWNQVVDNTPIAFPWMRSGYLDIVAPKWQAIVAEDYSYVLPLPVRKRAGISYVYPADYTQQMGVFGEHIASEETVDQMLEIAVSSFKFLEINLNYHNHFHFTKGKSKRRRNFELSLNRSHADLMKGYHHNTRRNVKKAAKFNLRIKKVDSPTNTIELFNSNKGKKSSIDIKEELLLQLVDYGLDQKCIEIREVWDEQEAIGGAIFFQEGIRKVFLFSGLSKAGRNMQGMFYLIDHLIQEHADTSTILDFEGSDDANLGKFYQRFGAEEKLYLQLKVNRLPIAIRWLK
jgi:hypothetical protein